METTHIVICLVCKTQYTQKGDKPHICGACGSERIAIYTETLSNKPMTIREHLATLTGNEVIIVNAPVIEHNLTATRRVIITRRNTVVVTYHNDTTKAAPLTEQLLDQPADLMSLVKRVEDFHA